MSYGQRTVVLVALGLLAGGRASAGDYGITGKKLLIKNDKIVVLSKDPTITFTGSNPVTGSDSSIAVSENSVDTQFDLPETGWSSNGTGTIFKYKNVLAPSGPSPVKLVKIKTGLFKAVVKRVPEAVPNGPASVDVVLNLDGSSNSYCMNFTGSGDGKKFSAKDAAAGSCPPPATCGNNSKEGAEDCDGADDSKCPGDCQIDCSCPVDCPGVFIEHAGTCWALAAYTGCDQFCAENLMTYDLATASYAGSGGSNANCQALLGAFGLSVFVPPPSCDDGVGCAVIGLGGITRCASPYMGSGEGGGGSGEGGGASV